MQEFIVSEEHTGMRADSYLAVSLPKYSRSMLAKLFDGQVLVNNKAASPSKKLKTNDRMSVDITILSAKAPDIILPIIYEDDNVAVINKPAGILTHAKGGLLPEATVASFIESRYSLAPDELLTNKTGIVHRLDRDTSGVIIVAKNMATQRFLQKQFSERQVQKIYIALVEGVPDPAEAIIDAPIGRNPKRPQTFKVTPEGRQAKTQYKILSTDNGKSLLELQPTTGRTHQLRVHLDYIGHPIIGDRFYGQPGQRLKLHALSLLIKLPDGSKKLFETDKPKF